MKVEAGMRQGEEESPNAPAPPPGSISPSAHEPLSSDETSAPPARGESPSPSSDNRRPAPRRGGWAETAAAYRWPAVAAFLLLLLYLAYTRPFVWTERAGKETASLVRHALDKAPEIAARFRSGTITHTFLEELPTLLPAGGQRLEVGLIYAFETFASTSDKRILWDYVSLGTTEAEIRVPVTFRYHVRLADPWRIEVSGQTCIVHAPALAPTLPPAIHTDKMQKRTASGWLRFDEAKQLTELERNLTPALRQRAGDTRHLALVRDQARRNIADFIRVWLLREDHWRTDRFRAIKVVFPDEEDRETAPPPVLRLEEEG